ncbi:MULTISPECIES: metallophosphoesterase family protein [Microvirga]|uniref:metallophosphoesterase family protein n=1 Tax=Microvirga TaxID=186650 RepID=UPI0021C70F04|nr:MULTISPECIES: metallophosphoesterase family protein [unclassified Microvirga]
MTIFYTSDTHFRHKAVLHFDRRPFITAEEMEEEIIRRWNQRVRPTDTVWHLGDFVWGKGQHAAAILGRLNGQKHFVWGNHDHSTVKRLPEWVSSQAYAEIRDGQDFVVLSHYGHRVWNKAHYGAFHLYGHSHGSLPPQGRSHDVGTNVWDYRPVTLPEVKERLAGLGLLESYGVHHGQETRPVG